MRNDPGKSPDPGDAERRERMNRRLKSLEDGTGQAVPFEELAAEMLADPEVRYQDNQYKARRDTLYERFEEAFFSSKLTVGELARQAQVSPTTVQALLQREGMPRREVIERLATALVKPTTYFLDEGAG
jgi:aspartate/methionine/tyrosine aminotransferase